MAFDVGSVVAHVKADLTNFKQGMAEAKNTIEDTGESASKFGMVLKGALVAGAAAAAAGVVILGKASLDAAADFEQTKIAFETMLGSASKANKLLKELQEFAKATPFNLVELQEGSKRLLAYGTSADKLIPTLKVLGDISSGVGKEKLPDLIRAFGQVQAKGKLMAQELNQFAEAGVPLREMLAKDLKMSLEEFSTELDKGNLNIKFGQVEASLASLTEEGGRFNDLMEKQSKTFSGSLSNLQDSWQQLLVVLGTGFLPIATQIVQTLTGFLTPIMQVVQGNKSLQEAFGLSAEQTKFLQGILFEFQSFLFDTLIPAVQTVVEFLVIQWHLHKEEFIAVWQIIWGVIQVVWALIYGLLKVGLELLAGDWEGAWQAILQMTNNVWNGLKSIFNGAISFIKSWGGQVFDALTKPFRDAWNTVQDLVRKIKDALDFTKRHSPSVVDIVKTGVREVNKAMNGLEFSTTLAPNVASSLVGGSANTSVANVTVDLSGAIISDELAAMRIGEKIGDSIISKLKLNVRF